MKKQSAIINKWKGTPPKLGERFTKKSLTIIGQEITPEEMSRRYAQGFPIPQKIYTDVGIQQFKDLSLLDQIDFLRELEATNRASNRAIRMAEDKLKAEAAERQAQDREKAIRDKVIQEMQSKGSADPK